MGQNIQESRLKYWATRSSICSHCSLINLFRPARSAVLTHLLAHSHAREKEINQMVFLSVVFSILDYSAPSELVSLTYKIISSRISWREQCAAATQIHSLGHNLHLSSHLRNRAKYSERRPVEMANLLATHTSISDLPPSSSSSSAPSSFSSSGASSSK